MQGKVALITGGSRGIGAAIAKRLAQEGANVAISYTSSHEKALAIVQEIESMGVAGAAFQADQADSQQIEKMVNAVAKQFGRIDILVNNAGVYIGGKIDDLELDVIGLKRQQRINVDGVVIATRNAVRFMSEGGRIILIGSINGEHVFQPGVADYSATKAALSGYTKGWARDLGPKKITVNLIQPGPINTDMNPDDTDFAKAVKTYTALGRYGKPEEVAAAVAFIASPEASYITGATLTVDGGCIA